MIEFGRTLREAREAKGLSISQIAETTRIMHSIIDGLENENFSGIPAPIYGRGFVKLYCEAVGLDPKPMIAEFMEIYNGNRDVNIKERPRSTAPEPAPEPAPAPAHDEELGMGNENHSTPSNLSNLSGDSDLSAATPVPEPEPEPEQQDEQEPDFAPESSAFHLAQSSEPDLFATTPPEPPPQRMPERLPESAPERPAQSISRYATPVRPRPEYRLPPMLGRWAALGLGALVIVVLAALGLRALYRATSPAPSAVEDATPKAAAAVVAAEKRETAAAPQRRTAPQEPRKERVPQKIPPLYMD